MMNETNQNPAINDMPITLEEDEAMLALEQARLPKKEGWDNAQPETAGIPIQDFALLGTMLKALTDHIERVVERQFAALVENHKTLALMDDSMRTAITEMIDDRIHEHEQDNDHWTVEALDSNTEAFMDSYMRQSEYVTEGRLADKVSDLLEDILEDRMQSLLNNASIEINL